MADDDVVINDRLRIPAAELAFRASRSGGPGGQHANTSSTRVELIWDVASSPSLDDEQRARLLESLASRITVAGELILASEATRSQHRNREDVVERFASIVRDALHVPAKRRKTRPTRASKERRIQSKKRRSERKKLRRSIPLD